MTSITTQPRGAATTRSAVVDRLKEDPAYQAFWLMRIAFTVAPIVFGLDKFFHILVDWDIYMAPRISDNLIPGTTHEAMYVVGVVEIIAGLAVALRPRYGAYIVAAWLAGIVVNLLLIPDFYDVALRDFGLLLAALTLARLASIFDRGPLFGHASTK
jgi:uncharacterized membrane protein YphA (DoxX/SURF4 family)